MPYSPLIPAQDLSFGVCFGMRAATCVKAGAEAMDIIDWVTRLCGGDEKSKAKRFSLQNCR